MSKFYEGFFEDSFIEDPNKESKISDGELMFDNVDQRAKVIVSKPEKIQTRMIVNPSGQIAEIEIHEMRGVENGELNGNDSNKGLHKINKKRRS